MQVLSKSLSIQLSLILLLSLTPPPPMHCLNLIYGISFPLCHGLWSYIMLSYLVTEKGQTGGTVQDQYSALFCP